jgi:exopolysaccharide biosynthesis protein
MAFTRLLLLLKRSISRLQHKPLFRSLVLIVLSFLTLASGQFTDAFPGNAFLGRALAAASHHPTPTVHVPQSLSLPAIPSSVKHNPLPSARTISHGVVFATTTLGTATGPVLVNVLDIDLTDPHVRLGVVQAHDVLVSRDETVSSMADRTGAVAGINGDYFEVNGPGRPIGMVTVDGRLLQSPNSSAALGVTESGTLTMETENFSGSVTNGRASYPLNAINVYNQASKGLLVLTTPELGTAPNIKGDDAVLLQPISTDTFVVQSKAVSTPLPTLTGKYALIGNGPAAGWLKDRLHTGDHLQIHTSVSPHNHLVQAIGGGPILIKNGAIYQDPHSPNPAAAPVRNPLTAISLNRSGTHARMFVFDGRGAGPVHSVGLTYAQAANYLLAQGAYSAMLFDTGGSTDMAVRLPGQNVASVVNWPSEGHERPVGNGLFVFRT